MENNGLAAVISVLAMGMIAALRFRILVLERRYKELEEEKNELFYQLYGRKYSPTKRRL